jgi:hypothetical protein
MITILDIIHWPCVLFKTQLNSTGLSVPNRKHITSVLRAQQVNAIYRFVTMVYEHNYHNSGHNLSPCFLFKMKHFGDYLRLQEERTQLGPIDAANLCLLTPVTILQNL